MNASLIKLVWIWIFTIGSINVCWNSINPLVILKTSSVLCHIWYYVKICWCVVDHWIRLWLFFEIAKLSCFAVVYKRLLLKFVFHKFCFRFVEHIVLSFLLIDRILNSLVIVHQSNIFNSSLRDPSRKWKCSSVAAWMSSFYWSFRSVVSCSSSILVLHCLFIDVRVSRFYRNDLFFKSVVKQRIPVYSRIEI